MSSDEAALEALTNGTVGVALVWAPALWALQRSDAGFAEGPPAWRPIRCRRPSADVGAAAAGERVLPAHSVDQAIASLTARRDHPGHLGRQRISRDCREMTVDC